jgi:choline kinase
MNIIIFGDKYQKGMKSKGVTGLLKHNKAETIIDHQYKTLTKIFPSSKIIYVYGFDDKKFISHINKKKYTQKKLTTIYNPYYDTKNTGFNLRLVDEFLNDDILFMFGYSKLNLNLFKRFNRKMGSQIFIGNKNNYNVGCIIVDDTITNISPDLTHKLSDIFYISHSDIKILKNITKDKSKDNYFMFEIINQMIELGSIIKPYQINANKKNVNYVK